MTAKVLIVDDIIFNVKLLETKLQQEYYEVFSARNGVEAIAKIKTINPDIVLMDVMMPEMDGMQATRIIKSDPEIAYIPVIIITALNAQVDKVNGLQAGADDFLTKPIDDQALLVRIKSLLRLKFMIDELRARHLTSSQLGIATEIAMNETNQVSGAKVILVDDDLAQSKKMKEILAAENIHVDITAQEEEVLKLAEQDHYSLFIISTQLLDFDGLRLCSHIRNTDKFRNTPILIIVEETDEKSLVKGLEIGVNDYLISPIDVQELVARVNTQIRRKNYQDALRENYIQNLSLSVIDPLTTLYNRRYLDIHIKNLINKATMNHKPLSLIMIDIDHFKNINDQYGHQVGDLIIKEVARQMLAGIRSTDLCARYGGEEFVILLPETRLEDAAKIGERIRISVEETSVPGSKEQLSIHCTISLGVSAMTGGVAPEELLKKADDCLYIAKENGRNRLVIEEAHFS